VTVHYLAENDVATTISRRLTQFSVSSSRAANVFYTSLDRSRSFVIVPPPPLMELPVAADIADVVRVSTERDVGDGANDADSAAARTTHALLSAAAIMFTSV